jgi:hypothetical protein
VHVANKNNHAKACTPSADAATSATSTTAIRNVRFTSTPAIPHGGAKGEVDTKRSRQP